MNDPRGIPYSRREFEAMKLDLVERGLLQFVDMMDRLWGYRERTKHRFMYLENDADPHADQTCSLDDIAKELGLE